MRRLALISLICSFGCPAGDTDIGGLDDDTTGDASDPSTPSSSESDTTGEPPGSSTTPLDESSSTGEPPPSVVCPSTSQCSLPLAEDCANGYHDCGGIYRFDEAGCPRDWCEIDDDCEGTDRCVDPTAWGIPCPFAHECSDGEDGTCECGIGLSCGFQKHCVSADVFPGAESGQEACAARLDQDACAAPIPGEPPGECAWVLRGESAPNPATCEEITAAYTCMYVLPAPEDAEYEPCPGDSGLVPWFGPADGDPSPETARIALLPETATATVVDPNDWIRCFPDDPYGVCDCACDLE